MGVLRLGIGQSKNPTPTTFTLKGTNNIQSKVQSQTSYLYRVYIEDQIGICQKGKEMNSDSDKGVEDALRLWE